MMSKKCRKKTWVIYLTAWKYSVKCNKGCLKYYFLSPFPFASLSGSEINENMTCILQSFYHIIFHTMKIKLMSIKMVNFFIIHHEPDIRFEILPKESTQF